MPLISKEEGGIINHFYCSINNDVTVGVGHFMKTANDAAALFNKGIRFYKGNNIVINVSEVIEEWERIKEVGKNRNWYAHKYKQYATLFLKSNDLERIFDGDFRVKANLLYNRKPIAFFLPLHIQYVLVDTLYNPAGIKLFGQNPKVKMMWKYFSDYINDNNIENLRNAKKLYEEIWLNAAPKQKNYLDRVKSRLRMFEIGIQGIYTAKNNFYLIC
jgi:hypothetical protein